MEDIESLKKQIALLEKRLSAYENDATYRGYYSLNRIVNAQVDYLNKFDLSKEIALNPKEEKVYDRACKLWEGMKSIITDLNTLKSDLGIVDGQEKSDMVRKPFIETIADKRN